MKRNIEFWFQRDWGAAATWSLWIKEVSWSDGVVSVGMARPLEFAQITKENECVEQPRALRLNYDSLQQIMDQLWTVGVRPTAEQGSAGQLASVQAHLNDLRRICFHQLKIPAQTD